MDDPESVQKQLTARLDRTTQSVQHLLDSQWDGLQSQKSRLIHTARRGISRAMADMLDTTTSLAELTSTQIARRGQTLEKYERDQRSVEELRARVREIEVDSEAAAELEQLVREESEVRGQMLDLERRMNELKKRRDELAVEVKFARSKVAAKSSRYRAQLVALEGQGGGDDETVRREMQALEAIKKEHDTGAEALRDGIVVWKDVCLAVTELERQLVEDSNSAHGLVGAEEKIAGAAQVVKRNYEIAEKNGWSLLQVAITHELEALEEGIEMVRVHESGVLGKSSKDTV